jgi:hypothetical protein
MNDRSTLERVFRQIAVGFNLTEGEVEETLKLTSEGLKNAIKDCFRQIEQPQEKFTEEDYKYLTEIVGCVNLEEQLAKELLTECYSYQAEVVAIIFDMPLKFTEDELLVELHLHGSLNYNEVDKSIIRNVLNLLSHPKVKYLIKDGDYYSLNLNVKVG